MNLHEIVTKELQKKDPEYWNQTAIWIDALNKPYEIKNMTDDHLRNTINYMNKWAPQRITRPLFWALIAEQRRRQTTRGHFVVTAEEINFTDATWMPDR